MRKIPLVKSLMYHIYNRGVSKQKIFIEDLDYRFFIFKMRILKKKYHIKIIAYCVMPNHFHFIIYTLDKAENISKFMKALQLSYAHYYNKKYKHSGHVFQGRFNNKEVINLEKVIDYIEQNPVKKGLVKRSKDWHYQG